jgi:hypothetical protein
MLSYLPLASCAYKFGEKKKYILKLRGKRTDRPEIAWSKVNLFNVLSFTDNHYVYCGLWCDSMGLSFWLQRFLIICCFVFRIGKILLSIYLPVWNHNPRITNCVCIFL